MSLTQKIYLFFSNWFGYKRREGHTNKFLNASERVLHYDLDADLKWKENKHSAIQTTDGIAAFQIQLCSSPFFFFWFFNETSILIHS